jgi:MOSC domain-containing protein YiiM
MAALQDGSRPNGTFRGRLESVQVSNGGVPKFVVDGPVAVQFSGVAGDRQRNRIIHGGLERAVCLFSDELIAALRAEGHPIDRGTTGENLTISGLDWTTLAPGTRLAVGSVRLEIAKPADPCKNIAASFADRDFTPISSKVHPGRCRYYARVLAEGSVTAGDAVEVQD